MIYVSLLGELNGCVCGFYEDTKPQMVTLADGFGHQLMTGGTRAFILMKALCEKEFRLKGAGCAKTNALV